MMTLSVKTTDRMSHPATLEGELLCQSWTSQTMTSLPETESLHGDEPSTSNWSGRDFTASHAGKFRKKHLCPRWLLQRLCRNSKSCVHVNPDSLHFWALRTIENIKPTAVYGKAHWLPSFCPSTQTSLRITDKLLRSMSMRLVASKSEIQVNQRHRSGEIKGTFDI